MRQEWFYKFFPSSWWRHTKGMDPAQKGDFMDDATLALQSGERGKNPLADFMFAEMDKVSDAQRDRANKRWKTSPTSSPSPDAVVCRGMPRYAAALPRNADAMQNQNKTETETETEEEEKERKTETETETETEAPPLCVTERHRIRIREKNFDGTKRKPGDVASFG